MLFLEILGMWLLASVLGVIIFQQAIKFGRKNDPTHQ